jgi:glycosyltransferase involved in cell wall biosynthesis
MRDVDEVVVCSSALAESRIDRRAVTIIPNAVDVDHFRRPRQRPADLPDSPVVVYVGTLHNARVDVELLLELAAFLRDVNIALVGPDALQPGLHARLSALPNVALLGARPYADVPGYLQHAEVVIVPHVVSAFTESLDPIKAYESLAIDTPTVATPVAGFRELAPEVVIAERALFPEEVARVLKSGRAREHRIPVPSWHDRGRAFEEVLLRAAASSRRA